MAENEILDLKGRRWRFTRQFIADPGASAVAIGDSAGVDLEDGLRKDLNRWLREGTPLLVLLKAAQQDQRSMRDVIESFKNKSLARIVAQSIKQCGEPLQPHRIAQYAAELLISKATDKLRGHVASQPHLADADRRGQINAGIEERIQGLRGTIASMLKQSLEGSRLKPGPRRERPTVEPIATRTVAVLGTSLLIPRAPPDGQRKPH
jgi:hypothetical protein